MPFWHSLGVLGNGGFGIDALICTVAFSLGFFGLNNVVEGAIYSIPPVFGAMVDACGPEGKTPTRDRGDLTGHVSVVFKHGQAAVFRVLFQE